MKILIVEDEHRIAQSMKKGLEQEKYTTDLAHTGNNGYDLASTGEYDLVILDLMLPEMDCITICRKLRKSNVHTPILMLTAKSQIHDKVSGLDAGADDYLTKPFSFEELLARTRALTRRPPTTRDEILKIADLILDTKLYLVKRANKTIHLTRREFSLLEYFMRNAGKILTKDHIIYHVWEYDADILPNTIEVYIRNLRNKIDTPFNHKKPLIHTVRGFGYKIEG